MQVTIYSFFSAVASYSVFILMAYAFRKIRWPKSNFGWPLLLLLYLLCIIRLFIPIEIPQAFIIESRQVYPFLMRTLSVQIGHGLPFKISILNALLILWGSVSAILLIRFILQYRKAIISIERYAKPCSNSEYKLLQRAMRVSGCRGRVKLLHAPNIETPFGIGVFKRKILLPQKNLTEKERHYILLHECTHFVNKDILLKLLISIFCIIFWWNPVVYLLKTDLEHTLEVKCDISVAKKLNAEEKTAYLKTIIGFVKGRPETRRASNAAVAFLSKNAAIELKERFLAVAEECPNKGQRLYSVAWASMFIFLVCVSYLFLPQPVSDPPPIANEFDASNAYLIEIAPYEYELFIDGKAQGKISQTQADIYIKGGFYIIKENKV